MLRSPYFIAHWILATKLIVWFCVAITYRKEYDYHEVWMQLSYLEETQTSLKVYIYVKQMK